MENVEFICKWQENIMVDGDSWFNSLGPERVLAVVKRMYNLASCSSSPIVQKQAKINFLNETVVGLLLIMKNHDMASPTEEILFNVVHGLIVTIFIVYLIK